MWRTRENELMRIGQRNKRFTEIKSKVEKMKMKRNGN